VKCAIPLRKERIGSEYVGSSYYSSYSTQEYSKVDEKSFVTIA